MMTLFIFIFILSILILVHEWGHYITAKKCVVKVEQFALGFGPKIAGWVSNGTEFALCAIPLGGYVKMAGDERDQCKGVSGEFFGKSIGHRALIVVMGPVVNLVLAYACFWAVFMIGHVDLDASAKKVPALVGQVLEGSAAQKAGIIPGDKILNVSGKAVLHWPDLQEAVTTSQAAQLSIVLERQGQRIEKTLVPSDQTQKDIFGRTHVTRRIGVGPRPMDNAGDLVITRYGFFQASLKAVQELGSVTVKTCTALYEMALGLRSPKEAMGIIGMFFIVKFAITVGFSFLLHIVGVISASLAIFNLLPVVPLDGGHLFLMGLEKLRGRTLSLRMDRIITRAGFSLIIVLAVFVFYSDFERIGLIDRIVNIWPH
ncbi:MAG TPA: M50 family metallopeptidase [Candidatus Omnitrophota bacterium]|nr:M50 family metallopeptidase [Candidatus Omnitrophota bacterium]